MNWRSTSGPTTAIVIVWIEVWDKVTGHALIGSSSFIKPYQKGDQPMTLEAVIALVVGTVVVLVTPALILSTDISDRYKAMREKTQEN
jgi:hypothetical protein